MLPNTRLERAGEKRGPLNRDPLGFGIPLLIWSETSWHFPRTKIPRIRYQTDSC